MKYLVYMLVDQNVSQHVTDVLKPADLDLYFAGGLGSAPLTRTLDTYPARPKMAESFCEGLGDLSSEEATTKMQSMSRTRMGFLVRLWVLARADVVIVSPAARSVPEVALAWMYGVPVVSLVDVPGSGGATLDYMVSAWVPAAFSSLIEAARAYGKIGRARREKES